MWSNKAERDRLSVEKGHSLSMAIRVEDRLHRDIIATGDKLWFTVRPDSYEMSPSDVDATISAEGVITTTPQGKVFRVDVQASQLALDPELEWFYDLTYVTGGYSVSLRNGEFEVAPNVTNRGAGSTFAGGNGAYSLVATVSDRNLVNVTSSLPMPQKGDNGTSTLLTNSALSEVIGAEQTIPGSSLETFGREIALGDLLFSTVTKGVLAQITAIQLAGGVVSVTATTKQVYGLETLKALLDTALRPESITQIDLEWLAPKAAVQLPPGYTYRVGDLVFSQAAEAGALDKYLVVSLVTAVGASDLSVTTKIVYPMFADLDTIQDMVDLKVSKTQTINGVALTGPNTEVNADTIPDGTSKKTMTAAERSKLDGVATGATKNATDAQLRNRSDHTGMQAISTVTGLQGALDVRPTSEGAGAIWLGTQAMYDQIVVKNPTTLYFIKVA